MKAWYWKTRFQEQVIWPLREWWQKRLVLRYCPDMKHILKMFDVHYIDRQGIKRVHEERLDRGIAREQSLAYGETHWSTVIHLMRRISPDDGDIFVDLGCGKGQLCFFIRQCWKIPTIGVDKTGAFVDIAQEMASELMLDQLEFIEGDIFDFDLTRGTIFYVTSTCYDVDMMARLVDKFQEAPIGSWVASVTQTLNVPWLAYEGAIVGSFNWGQDTVFLYRRVALSDTKK